MSFRFILGRAGSGKTHFCLSEIIEEIRRSPEGCPLVLLVPDQSTYQMERALLQSSGLDGFIRVYPLSFRRLAYRTLGEVGGSPLPALDERGREMFLASVLRKIRKDLLVYGPSARRVGLPGSLAQCIAEFRRYRKSPEDVLDQYRRLEEAGRGETSLALKLHDLGLVYQVFDREIEGRFVDGEGQLNVLAERLPMSTWMDGARVWVDGFSGFTPQEYEVLTAIIEKAAEVSVSLCLDPERLPGTPADLNALSPFYPTEETYLRIRDRIPARVERRPAVKLSPGDSLPRFRDASSLAHLESEFFRREFRPFDRGPEEIRLVEAPDRRSEVRAAAREILSRVRDRGYRFRDMALILRDLGPYGDLVRSTFDEYKIPFFIDERRSMAHHPLVELVRSALRSAATGWPTDAVLQFLKTDLVGCGPETPEALQGPQAPQTEDRNALDRERIIIDEVENYALAFGVAGREWTTEDPWSKRALCPEDAEDRRAREQAHLERVDAARRRALKCLVDFQKRMSGEKRTVRDITGALAGMLRDLCVPEHLQAWTLESRETGDPAGAAEHAAAWRSVMDLLDGLVEALGDERMDLREYSEILEAGLSQLTLGLIPPALDEVTVGSVERSRHPDLRMAFVLGVGEGVFPRAKAEDPILVDRERDTLREAGFELAPGARRELHRERYFAYIALTRASESLLVSYPRADDEGHELLPSAFVRRMRSVFPEMKTDVLERDDTPARPDDVFLGTDLALAIVCGARSAREEPETPWWGRGLDRWVEDPEIRDVLEKTLPALAYRNRAVLGPSSAADLYGHELRSGVVSLEGFSRCPFQFFARSGLGLTERATYELKPLDLGSLYHEVLYRFFVRTQEENLRWSELDPEAGRAIVREELEEAVPRLKADVLRASARNRALLDEARRTLEEYIEVLLFQARRTEFKPRTAEIGFRNAPDLDLGGGRKLRIRGRIDRVDVVPGTGPLLARVVDYKLSNQKLDLWKVEQGLALQLTTYLLALESAPRDTLGVEAVQSAGAFFAPLRRSMGKATGEPVDEPGDEPPGLKEYRMRGVYGEECAFRLDREIEPQQSSRLHSMYRKKEGGLGKLSTTDYLPEGVLNRLIRTTEERLREIGDAILSGRIAIEPCRIRRSPACTYCDYMAVCRFEPPGNPYRTLDPVKREDVVRALEARYDG